MAGPETIQTFFLSRKPWIDVGVVENFAVNYEHSNYGVEGSDFDVVIRLDGSYPRRADAEFIANFFRGRLAGVGLLLPRSVQAEERGW